MTLMRGVLSNRSVIRLSGDDARPFLQGLVTQDVLNVKENEAAFATLLTPQGKILFDFFLTPTDDGFLIDVAKEAAEALNKRLTMYKLRAKVSVSIEEGLAVAVGDMRDPMLSFADPRHVSLPPRAIVQTASIPPADADYDRIRLDIGVPEFGKDFAAEEVFLLDVNYDALNGVSYKKGCFVGQEVTSRMKRKGEIRKRTLIATFDGAPPARSASLEAGDNAIGEILSGREGSALALIRLDRLKAAEDVGAALTAEGKALQIAFPDYLERD